MQRVLLHVGMPRAASTFFQRKLFPQVKGFHTISVSESFHSAAYQKLLYQDESLYDAEAVKEQLHQSLRGDTIISNELFIGQSLYQCMGNRSRNAIRLAQVFPNAEIILVLRDSAELLQSLYSIDVAAGFWGSPEEYLVFPERAQSYPTFRQAEYVEGYRYAPLIELYQSLFERVHLFFYEHFKAEPQDYLAYMQRCLQWRLQGDIQVNERVNAGLSAFALVRMRRLNRLKPLLGQHAWTGQLLRWRERGLRKNSAVQSSFHFPPVLAEQLKRYFAEDKLQVATLAQGREGLAHFMQA